MRYTIKNYEVVNWCVYNLYVIVLELWAIIMLYWPTSNRLNSKQETLNRIGLMLGQYRRRWANLRLLLDQCLVLLRYHTHITRPHNHFYVLQAELLQSQLSRVQQTVDIQEEEINNLHAKLTTTLADLAEAEEEVKEAEAATTQAEAHLRAQVQVAASFT